MAHGQYRRSLQSIGVTPLQAGVLQFLHRHADANMRDTAHAFCVRVPTMSEVIRDLVRKRWVTERRSVTEFRTLKRSPSMCTVDVKTISSLLNTTSTVHIPSILHLGPVPLGDNPAAHMSAL